MTIPKEIIRREISRRRGRARAIKASALARLANVAQREIAVIALELQREGFPIISSKQKPFGYFYAANREEVEIYLAQLKSFRGELSARIDAVAALVPPAEPVQMGMF